MLFFFFGRSVTIFSRLNVFCKALTDTKQAPNLPNFKVQLSFAPYNNQAHQPFFLKGLLILTIKEVDF